MKFEVKLKSRRFRRRLFRWKGGDRGREVEELGKQWVLGGRRPAFHSCRRLLRLGRDLWSAKAMKQGFFRHVVRPFQGIDLERGDHEDGSIIKYRLLVQTTFYQIPYFLLSGTAWKSLLSYEFNDSTGFRRNCRVNNLEFLLCAGRMWCPAS